MIPLLVLLLLIAAPAWAQVQQPGFTCENQGSPLNFAPILNCGAGTTCAWTAPGICTITAAGSGGTITGSGTSPNLTRWTGTSSIGNFGGSTCGGGTFASAIAADGTLTCSTPASGISGSGASPQVTVWSGATSITGFSHFTYTDPTLTLSGTANALTLSGSSTGNPAIIATTGTDTSRTLQIDTGGGDAILWHKYDWANSITGTGFIQSPTLSASQISIMFPDFGPFIVAQNDFNTAISAITAGTGAKSAFYLARSRGSVDTPTQTLADDELGIVQWNGKNQSTGWTGLGMITMRTNLDVNSVAASNASRMTFAVAQSGVGVRDALQLSANGLVVFPLNAPVGSITATSPALKGGGAGATLAVRTAADGADAPLSASTLTLSSRTGTAATAASFDSTGKLVEGSLPLSLTSAIQVSYANEGSVGTTQGLLVKVISDPPVARNLTTSDTVGAAFGVCSSGCGTTGSAAITIMGFASCQFDGSTTALNYVVVSTTSAGKCSDGGSTFPSGVTVIGKVQSTNVGAGTYPITVYLNDVASATSGGNGRGTTVTINGSNVASNNGNFNDTTPTATAGNILATWQKTNGNPSTISAQVSASGLLDVISTTQGTILYRGASAWSALAVGTSGQFLQTQGASANPQWATPNGTTGGVPTVKTYTNLIHPSLNTGSLSHTSLTVRTAAYFQVPYTITANQMSVAFLTVPTPGTFKLCVYSQDGSTKLIDQTVTPAANSTISATLSPAVVIGPGEYYAVFGCATTCSATLTAAINPTVPFNVTSSPSGKTPWIGQVTHTSGTCNTTLGSLSNAAIGIPVLRFDN